MGKPYFLHTIIYFLLFGIDFYIFAPEMKTILHIQTPLKAPISQCDFSGISELILENKMLYVYFQS